MLLCVEGIYIEKLLQSKWENISSQVLLVDGVNVPSKYRTKIICWKDKSNAIQGRINASNI